MKIRFAALGGFVALMLLLAGCKENRQGEVKGTVKLDGVPIEKGSINFIPADGKTGTGGSVIQAGNYFAKIPVGMMKVTINVPKETGEMKKAYDTPGSRETPVMKESLPDQFAKKELTTLEYEVKPGMNVKDWDLKSK